jgi:hypothetical protein
MQEEEVEAVRQTAARLANTNRNKKKLLESLGAAGEGLACQKKKTDACVKSLFSQGVGFRSSN